MDAVILAGGRGSRLRGVVAEYHKPLLVVNGRPLLLGVYRAATEVVDGRIIIVTAPSNVQPIVELLDTADAFTSDRTRVIVQPNPTGPGDGLRLGLEVADHEETLVLCADNVMTTEDVQAVADGGALPTIGVKVTEDQTMAIRLARISESFEVIEGRSGGVWSDGRYRCWLGPLLVPTSRMYEVLTEAKVSASDELKIASHLNQLGSAELVRVNCHDVGTLDAI